MALLRYKNFLANNIVVLIVKDKGTEFLIQYCGADGIWREQLFKKPNRIRVMINGNITNQINAENDLVVYGDIERAKVGNKALVEGYVTNYSCPRNSIIVDRGIRVQHGNDIRTNEDKQVRASILHIDGDIVTASVEVYNVDLETVVGGNCKSVIVGNKLGCRGTVSYLEPGNVIACTMGKSIGKTAKQKRKEKRETNEEYRKEMEAGFKSLMERAKSTYKGKR